jgi:hypothetical protein
MFNSIHPSTAIHFECTLMTLKPTKGLDKMHPSATEIAPASNQIPLKSTGVFFCSVIKKSARMHAYVYSVRLFAQEIYAFPHLDNDNNDSNCTSNGSLALSLSLPHGCLSNDA